MNINLDKVPKDLDDCVEQLKATLTPNDIEFIKGIKPCAVHFTMGRYLRNNWSLWEDNILTRWFKENLKLGCADDLSGIILDCLWADIKGQPREIEKIVKEAHEHWKRYGCDPITGEQIGENQGNGVELYSIDKDGFLKRIDTLENNDNQ